LRLAWRLQFRATVEWERLRMTPISSSPGWVSRKPNTTGTPAGAGPAFQKQLQDLLDQTHSPTIVPGSHGGVGSLHAGGMNDAAQRLMKLGGH
jgi:hypothetical protein